MNASDISDASLLFLLVYGVAKELFVRLIGIMFECDDLDDCDTNSFSACDAAGAAAVPFAFYAIFAFF